MIFLQKRQLIALMFTDIVGYGTMTTENEALALELLEEYRALFRRLIPVYGGRENKTIGDGFFVEFGSALEAVLCAIEVQTTLYERNLLAPRHRWLHARIGIHLGDVVLAEGDSLGEGVNIAARIEAFAEPGGICVSRQVADQLLPYEHIRVRKIGTKALKHIRMPTTLFKIELPWEQSRGIRRWLPRRRRPNASHYEPRPLTDRLGHAVVHAILASVLIVFSFLIYRTVEGFRTYDLHGYGRKPASAQDERVSMADGWDYTTEGFRVPLENVRPEWKPLHRPYWPYADEMAKPYWLRKRFVTRASFAHPAIVLGPISGAHRAYLNGNFIGGSNFAFTLSYYTFDPKLLSSRDTNTLVVKVNPRPTLTPAFTTLPRVGSFLGEFNDVYASVVRNEFYYHVVQTIYLALAFLSFLYCFFFYLSNPTDRKYLYFAVYLLLGCMSLLHSNGIVSGFLDFRLQRAFRLYGLSLSSIVLLSTYFCLIGRKTGELVNNGLGIAWSLVVSALCLAPGTTANGYLASWNFVLGSTLVYSMIWVVTLFDYRSVRLLRDRNRWKSQLNKLRYESVILFFGILTAMLSLSSMKTEWARVVPHAWTRFFFSLGTTYPFFFALCVIGLGFYDYLVKNRAILTMRRQNDFQLEMAEVLRQCARKEEMIPAVHRKVSQFIQAERSSLYLLDENGNDQLTIHSVLGSAEASPFVRQTLDAKQGLLGYVCETKTPLLIWDIATDARFQEYLARRNESARHTFKSNSCMLFPLMIGGRLVGVLTLADKYGSASFNRRDFSLLHILAKDFALLIQSRRAA